MTRTALAAALATALCCTDAIAAVSGHCTYEGSRHALVDGVAWVEVDDEVHDYDEDGVPDEPREPDVHLAFGTWQIDAAAVQRAENRHDALGEQAYAQDEATKVLLTLSPESLIIQQQVWISPDHSFNAAGNEVGAYAAQPGAAGRVAGHYAYADEDAEDPSCEITFDLALTGERGAAPAPVLPGQPLPADGGEPGKVFLALHRAVQAGDFDAIVAVLPPDKAGGFRALHATPDYAQELAAIQAMTARNVTITGGRIDGDEAWIEFDGEEADVQRSGTAEMVRVEGTWYVRTESTRGRDE
jgi:hypothetical protein